MHPHTRLVVRYENVISHTCTLIIGSRILHHPIARAMIWPGHETRLYQLFLTSVFRCIDSERQMKLVSVCKTVVLSCMHQDQTRTTCVRSRMLYVWHAGKEIQ